MKKSKIIYFLRLLSKGRSGSLNGNIDNKQIAIYFTNVDRPWRWQKKFLHDSNSIIRESQFFLQTFESKQYVPSINYTKTNNKKFIGEKIFNLTNYHYILLVGNSRNSCSYISPDL